MTISNFLITLFATSLAGCTLLFVLEILSRFCNTLSKKYLYLLYKIITIYLLFPPIFLLLSISDVKKTLIEGHDYKTMSIWSGRITFQMILNGEIDSSSIFSILFLIWFVGFFIFYLLQLWKDKQILRKIEEVSKINNSEHIEKIMDNIKSELFIKKEIPIYFCYVITTPYITSAPKIFLPQYLFTNEEIKLVLKHELNHYKNHDIFIQLIFVFLVGFYWFNPFMSLFKQSMGLICEMSNDEQLLELEQKDVHRIYAELLLDLLDNNKKTNAKAICFSGKIKRRIKNIMKTRKNVKKSVAVITAIITMALCPLTTYAATLTTTKVIDGIERENSDFSDNAINDTNIYKNQKLESDFSVDGTLFQIERGSNFFDCIVNKNQRVLTEAITLNKGDKINLTFSSDNRTDSFRAGVVNSDPRYTYTNSIEGGIYFTYNIEKTDKYNILIIGNTSSDVHVSGTATVVRK